MLIHWIFFIEADNREALKRVLARIEDRLTLDVEIGNSERYWKAPRQFRVEATTRLGDMGFADAIYRALFYGAQISPRWTSGISGEIFSGAAVAIQGVPGLDAATMEIENVLG